MTGRIKLVMNSKGLRSEAPGRAKQNDSQEAVPGGMTRTENFLTAGDAAVVRLFTRPRVSTL